LYHQPLGIGTAQKIRRSSIDQDDPSPKLRVSTSAVSYRHNLRDETGKHEDAVAAVTTTGLIAGVGLGLAMVEKKKTEEKRAAVVELQAVT
jgi:hypothetical protein